MENSLYILGELKMDFSVLLARLRSLNSYYSYLNRMVGRDFLVLDTKVPGFRIFSLITLLFHRVVFPEYSDYYRCTVFNGRSACKRIFKPCVFLILTLTSTTLHYYPFYISVFFCFSVFEIFENG